MREMKIGHMAEAHEVWARLRLDEYEQTGLRVGIFGSSGSGKGWLLGVLLEELIALDLPVVMLDPEGELWTFREVGAVVIGGPQGDAPFTEDPDLIRRAVQFAYDTHAPVVFDLSGGEYSKSNAAILRAGQVVLDAVWQESEAQRQQVVLATTESSLFAPQQVPRGGAVPEELRAFMQRGRKRGVITLVETQRPADIQKQVISQCNVRFFGRMDDTLEYDAIKRHLPGRTFVDLQRLDPGMFICPQINGGDPINIRARSVTHGGGGPGTEIRLREDRTDPRGGEGALVAAFQSAARSDERSEPKAEQKDARRERKDPQVAALENRVQELQSDLAREIQTAARLERERDQAVERSEAAEETIDAIRSAWVRIMGDGVMDRIAANGTGGYSLEEIRRIVREELPATQGAAPVAIQPIGALRARYLEQAAQRLVERVSGLESDEREALLFLIAQDRFTTINAIAVGLTGSDSGSMHTRWSKAVQGLVSAGLAEQGGSGRTGRRASVEKFIRSGLSAHNPTDDEVQQVLNRALSVLQQ